MQKTMCIGLGVQHVQARKVSRTLSYSQTTSVKLETSLLSCRILGLSRQQNLCESVDATRGWEASERVKARAKVGKGKVKVRVASKATKEEETVALEEVLVAL